MKLNLCCGANVFHGWLNIDQTDVEADYLRHLRDAPKAMQWPAAQQALVDRIGEIEFWRHDVRKGLPFADGSVDAIYVGQAIEHFNRRTEAPAFLRECCRVLRQYGVIKLTTPDLCKLVAAYGQHPRLIDAHSVVPERYSAYGLDGFSSEQPAFYADALPEDQLSYLLFGASGADCTSQNYEGHFHCYTPRSLGQLLMECGFDVRTKDSDEFTDTIDQGMSHSFAIEGVKP